MVQLPTSGQVWLILFCLLVCIFGLLGGSEAALSFTAIVALPIAVTLAGTLLLTLWESALRAAFRRKD